MSYDEWVGRFKRLCAGYNRQPNGEQGATYYEALSHFPAPIIDQAIASVIRDVKMFPSAAELCERSRAAMSSAMLPASVCERCHGNRMVDSPDESHFNRRYTNFVRPCPECHHQVSAA